MPIFIDALLGGLYALKDYIALHVLTCLIPAFLLAGGKQKVLQLGDRARKGLNVLELSSYRMGIRKVRGRRWWSQADSNRRLVRARDASSLRLPHC